MPVAIGLNFVLAIFCAIHVVRTGQQMYWLFILFAFPVLGSIVYFLAIYLPNSRLQRKAFRAMDAAGRMLDPTREVREARAAFEDTPTAQNQMRLASALLGVGDAPAAVQAYEGCLQGPFAGDPEIRFGLARAYVECARFDAALRQLEPLRREHPDFRAEPVALLMARSLAGCGRGSEARAEFEAAVAKFGTFEARAEYAIWAYGHGEAQVAQRLQQELDKIASRWNAMARELNAASLRRLKAARDLAGKRA
jgi:hypothetical protein